MQQFQILEITLQFIVFLFELYVLFFINTANLAKNPAD